MSTEEQNLIEQTPPPIEEPQLGLGLPTEVEETNKPVEPEETPETDDEDLSDLYGAEEDEQPKAEFDAVKTKFKERYGLDVNNPDEIVEHIETLRSIDYELERRIKESEDVKQLSQAYQMPDADLVKALISQSPRAYKGATIEDKYQNWIDQNIDEADSEEDLIKATAKGIRQDLDQSFAKIKANIKQQVDADAAAELAEIKKMEQERLQSYQNYLNGLKIPAKAQERIIREMNSEEFLAKIYQDPALLFEIRTRISDAEDAKKLRERAPQKSATKKKVEQALQITPKVEGGLGTFTETVVKGGLPTQMY